SGADIAATSGAASQSAIHEHLMKYGDPVEASEHKDEVLVKMEHFSKAFEKVKSSSYQKATIYWDQEKNSSNNIIA
ncbi:hypothetical protein HOJ44_05365, partial [Candidatus Bathyarchaeota archaeon]|nr:hypothetical protein [Candidatus Bathyarchaeota archaeon]